MDTTPLLSLVVPVYNEEQGLAAFFPRVIAILEGMGEPWEILCVDDGSTDGSLAALQSLHAQDARIRYLSLSRNFGKEAALTAGLRYARGRAVIPIDSDLQDPPEMIPPMVAKWQEGYKVVLATRRARDETWAKRVSAAAFYRLIGRMASVRIPENTGDFRLMDRQVVEVLKLLPERTRFMKGLFAWVGFTPARVYYDRPMRSSGKTKYSYRALWRLAKDGIFSFTTLPLRLATYAGVSVSLVAIAYGSFIVIRTLVQGVVTPGYASLFAAVLFLGGIQLVSLGIIGEYVGRIYREAKQRPIYVVKEESA